MNEIVTKKNNAMRLSEILKRYDRSPFQDWLADLIEARPSPEELQAWARGSIDKHALVTKIVANLSGYSDSKVVTHKLDLESLSDSQLIDFIREQHKAIPILDAEAIDVEATDPPKDEDAPS